MDTGTENRHDQAGTCKKLLGWVISNNNFHPKQSQSNTHSEQGYPSFVSKAKCDVCQRNFKSTSTLQAHINSPRHLWRLKWIMERRRESQLDSQKLVSAKNIEENPELLREDGLLKLYSDQTQAILLLWQAGKVFAKKNMKEKSRECLKRVIVLVTEELANHKSSQNIQNMESCSNGDFPDTIPVLRTNSNSSSFDSSDSSERSQSRSGRSRVKRQKMEQLKQMYRDFELQRGSTDLYQTMLRCYDEDIEENYNLKGKEDDKILKSKGTLMKRDMVLTELADTEKDYVDNLEVVVKKIIPIFKGSNVPERLQDATSSIFGNVEEIYLFHKNVFLDKLEDCLEDPDLLGSSFGDHEETLMTIYATYCQNKPNADDLMKDCENEITEVYQQCCLKQKLTLKDFLIKPVQRLMKYQLLLQNIIKCTSKAEKDTSQMEVALKVMEVVPKVANDKLNVAMIIDHEGDLTEHELIFQDTLLVSIGRSKSKPREMRAFLFAEFLLMTEPVEREGRLPQYRFMFEGQTSRMGVTENVESDKYKFAILFRKYKTTDIYICTADSIEMKKSWMKVLRDLESVHGFVGSSFRSGSRSIRRHHSNEGHGSVPDFKLKREASMKDRAQWTTEEKIGHATIGHPRQNSMSEKLKLSIQRFLSEIYFQDDEDVFDTDTKNSSAKADKLNPDNRNDPDTTAESYDLDDTQPQNNANTHSGYHGEARDSFKEIFKINGNDPSQLNTINYGVNDIEHMCSFNAKNAHVTEELNNVKRTLTSLHSDKTNKPCVTSDSFRETEITSRKRYETFNAGENHRFDKKLPLEKKAFPKRTASLPPIKPDHLREKISISKSLSVEELDYYQIILSQSHYLVGLDEMSQSQEAACNCFDEALSLFFDVNQLKNFPQEYPVREDLLKRCTSLYQSLKARKSYSKQSTYPDRRTDFYSYRGLFSVLTAYARLLSVNDPRFSVVLYSLAVSSATTESAWEDALTIFQHLAQIYEAIAQFRDAVDSLIDTHYIQLETGDLCSAAKVLCSGFHLALLSRDFSKCIRLETLAEPVMDCLPEPTQSSSADMLRFLCEMSFAAREEHLLWFEERLLLWPEICSSSPNEELLELKELFDALYSWLREQTTIS